MSYEHLRLSRETPLTDRHPRRYSGIRPPADPHAHGSMLVQSLNVARQRAVAEDVGGFDERKLLKILLRAGDKSLPPFDVVPGVEIISQEDESIVLAFVTEQGLGEFETRLTTLARDGNVTRKELLYVIDGFDHWTPENRTGVALRDQGFPSAETFMLDAELWPQERQDKRERLLGSFLDWLRAQSIEKLDSIDQPSLVMMRIRCTRAQAEQVLRHRDVRTLDLPPRFGVTIELLHTDVNQFPPVDPPADDAPVIAVLDSGLTPGHPLLAAAVGDAQGYLGPHRSPGDISPWHGTFVSGMALYGNVEEAIRQGYFVPQLRLLSAKVFNDDGNDQTEFVEKAVEEAVCDLHRQYDCRVFNLSYGDLNKVYDSRHVRGLAYTLDRLTRELGVLFVVPSGNLLLSELPADARKSYPDYLFADSARLLDPATSLNALTVGGIALQEATRNAQRYPNTREDHPLARTEQPFPLTRCGPSINGAIKPDVVEHAGNVALMRVGGQARHGGLGVVSLNGGFASGPAFSESIGTSYAAPCIANKAARLNAELANATPNLLRTLIGAHARWPKRCEELLNSDGNSEGREKLLRLVGYGRVEDDALFRSLDHIVTLFTEERICNDQHHFFELPLPESFWSGGRRKREVSVALAYSPAVRTTRLDYRMSKLWFTLVSAASLDEVTKAFRRNRTEGMGERSNGRWLSNDARKNGTLQVSRWTFKQALANGDRVFVIVTRQDSPWSDGRDGEEPYALTVVLTDREHPNTRLYAHVRAVLEARAQVRSRARVQS
jgi:hypothetical protein